MDDAANIIMIINGLATLAFTLARLASLRRGRRDDDRRRRPERTLPPDDRGTRPQVRVGTTAFRGSFYDVRAVRAESTAECGSICTPMPGKVFTQVLGIAQA